MMFLVVAAAVVVPIGFVTPDAADVHLTDLQILHFLSFRLKALYWMSLSLFETINVAS
jgi:hypothetical protein